MRYFEVFPIVEPSQAMSPLVEIPAKGIDISGDRPVTEILERAGMDRFNSFSLVTPAIELCVSAGAEHSIGLSNSLCGLDEKGRLQYPGWITITVDDFLRAAQSGLYEGDPERLVVYPWGSVGGLLPDALHEVSEILLATGATLEGLKRIKASRARLIARKWRRSGLTGPRIIKLLNQQTQWDVQNLAKRLDVESGEAEVILIQSGRSKSTDGLWRLSPDENARTRAATLEAAERASEEWPLD